MAMDRENLNILESTHGKYSGEDVDPSIEKGVKTGIMAATDNTAEKKGIFKKLAETFGFDVDEKDENQPVIMAGKKMSNEFVLYVLHKMIINLKKQKNKY